MQISAERSERKLGVKVVIFDPAYMSKEFIHKLGFGFLGHADEIEGSHMLYKYPDLIDISKSHENVVSKKDLGHPDLRDMRDPLICVMSSEERKIKGILKAL